MSDSISRSLRKPLARHAGNGTMVRPGPFGLVMLPVQLVVAAMVLTVLVFSLYLCLAKCLIGMSLWHSSSDSTLRTH